ncbi:aspartate aminotransferase family protein [Microbacterium sp. SA39]|uniref:aspartate aminotransferase family protein n=1 Tax=Microbacterium sp. SA39 TaxID=1263625 RepID=UPI0005FA17DF|nr:aminotransferase class III-fold pyridoxal phosphate-dependent enzyme [Microbacterium sp. SA39]KJQ53888.1 Glutamate-1-semialdehyde 2,1-aminomutase 2 [Microbacterium sp. SA39]
MTTVTSALELYTHRTPTSKRLFDEARRIIPGGVSRATLAFEPYPFYAADAAGAVITDVDGNDYIDLVNNYTSLPHGHGHPGTTRAATAQLAVSSAIGAAHTLEAEFAAELRGRIPAAERLHFTTTGSEAVGFAVRMGRVATGRTRVLKFEGGFHGSHNELYQDIAVSPTLDSGTAVPARPASAGLEPTGTITAVYNDPESVRAAFARWGGEIAVVVVEPFLGNAALVTAEPAFLDAIFEIAHGHGALVLFDEVQSLRAGFHGAQGIWGYTPDLVALGKIMGGGHPLAAFGGRAELFESLQGPDPAVLQTGTFTATPVALAAGQAAMAELDPAAYEGLERRTERLRSGIRDRFGRAGVPVRVNGIGSMFNISISDVDVRSFRAFRAADTSLFSALRLEMLNRGVLIMPRGTGCLSTAVTDSQVDHVLVAIEEGLTAVRGNR